MNGGRTGFKSLSEMGRGFDPDQPSSTFINPSSTLANAVANAENLQLSACKEDLLQRFAVIIARVSANAILRRRPVTAHAAENACRRAANECLHLEV